MVYILKEEANNKYFRYKVVTLPYKNGLTKITVEDNYFDKSDYAFVDLETGEIKSYSDVALKYVINILKSAGMSMYDVKPNVTYKFYTEPHSAKVIDTELVENVMKEDMNNKNTKTMLELQSEELEVHIGNIDTLAEILDGLSEFETHLTKARFYCDSLRAAEDPDTDEATFLQELLHDIRDDINKLSQLSHQSRKCSTELLQVVDNLDKCCTELRKEN